MLLFIIMYDYYIGILYVKTSTTMYKSHMRHRWKLRPFQPWKLQRSRCCMEKALKG